MRYHRLTTALAAGLLTLLCACNAGTSAQPSPSPSSSPAAPSPTPTVSGSSEDTPASGGGVLSSFTAQDLNGNQVDQSVLADYQLTMVNIWATFCGPCLSEMPELGEIHAEYADKGVQVVGIVADVLNQDGSFNEDQIATAREAVSLTGADYLHLLPSTDLMVAKLQYVSAVPETIFVDSQGNQVGESYLGARSKDQWIAIIDELLTQVEE